MAELKIREAKLVQYLNEAYGKERQLETALEAHIAMASRANYRKRLQDHLKETRSHARDVGRRIKQLGGSPDPAPLHVPGPEVVTEAASKLTEVAQKGAALAQGPLHAVRGTGEQERQLKNAKTEYQDEAEEIANYTAIETLADSVGDRDTARLARSIKRQEERMSSFLERLIPVLTKEVVQAEIPRSERNGAGRRRSGTSPARRATASRGGSSARRATGSRRTTSSRRTAASRGRATSAGRRATASRSATSRAGAASRSGARRPTAASRSGASGSRSTARRPKARPSASSRSGTRRSPRSQSSRSR